MFGFPFFTSLIVTVAMVIVFSLVINHGIQKRKAKTDTSSIQDSHTKKAALATAKSS